MHQNYTFIVIREDGYTVTQFAGTRQKAEAGFRRVIETFADDAIGVYFYGPEGLINYWRRP